MYVCMYVCLTAIKSFTVQERSQKMLFHANHPPQRQKPQKINKRVMTAQSETSG